MNRCTGTWQEGGTAADITVTETVNKNNEMIYIVYSSCIVTCTFDIVVGWQGRQVRLCPP